MTARPAGYQMSRVIDDVSLARPAVRVVAEGRGSGAGKRERAGLMA